MFELIDQIIQFDIPTWYDFLITTIEIDTPIERLKRLPIGWKIVLTILLFLLLIMISMLFYAIFGVKKIQTTNDLLNETGNVIDTFSKSNIEVDSGCGD